MIDLCQRSPATLETLITSIFRVFLYYFTQFGRIYIFLFTLWLRLLQKPVADLNIHVEWGTFQDNESCEIELFLKVADKSNK